MGEMWKTALRSLSVHTQQGHSVVAAMLDKDPAQCLQDLIFKLPSNTAFRVLEWFCLFVFKVWQGNVHSVQSQIAI